LDGVVQHTGEPEVAIPTFTLVVDHIIVKLPPRLIAPMNSIVVLLLGEIPSRSLFRPPSPGEFARE